MAKAFVWLCLVILTYSARPLSGYPFAPMSILTLIARNAIPRTHGINNTTWRVAEVMDWAKKTNKLTTPPAVLPKSVLLRL
jgi:hypothetical protein